MDNIVQKRILADNKIKIEDDYYDNVLAILGGDFTDEEVELLLDEAQEFQQEETLGSHENIAKYGLYQD